MPHMQTRLILGAICLALSSAIIAQPYGDPINVQIVNQASTDRPVEVVDNICQRRVLDERIVAGASVVVQLCTIDFQGGDATVRDGLTGQEQRYRQVLGSAELQLP